MKELPLVLKTEDLKREFQISDSTLNRLIKLANFPSCWYGIRDCYSKDEMIIWYFQAFRTKRRGFKIKRESRLAYLDMEKMHRAKQKLTGSRKMVCSL